MLLSLFAMRQGQRLHMPKEEIEAYPNKLHQVIKRQGTSEAPGFSDKPFFLRVLLIRPDLSAQPEPEPLQWNDAFIYHSRVIPQKAGTKLTLQPSIPRNDLVQVLLQPRDLTI